MDSVPSANDEAASSSNVDIITNSDQDAIIKKEDAAEGTYMDPQLYDAAVEGNIEPFKDTAREIDSIITPNKNTILHINIMSRNRSSMETASTMFVEDILDGCRPLLFKVNANAETPLHVAAKYGHSDMVEVLIKAIKAQNEELESGIVKAQNKELESGIEAAKLMLRRTNNEGNTALHEAVKHQHLNVLKILTKEDPDFTYDSNNLGETPLYIAAKNSSDLVDEILQTCTSPTYEGPDQMTALHAAAKHYHPGIIRKILEKKKSLIKERDQYGWTPLHYAVYLKRSENMKALLECDVSTTYIGDQHRRMTPLHIAIGRGYIPHEIISHCPDCCELVDERRWNILHFAMLSLTAEDLKNLLKHPLIRNLINDKDVDGNTPLHFLAAFRSDLLWEIEGMVGDIKLDLDVVNNQNMSVLEVMRKSDSGQLKQEILKLEESVGPYQYGVVRVKKESDGDEKVKKNLEKIIATVTFTAAFTLPGGVIQDGDNKGTAILSKKAAFQAFVITDAIAMVLSLSAVFAHYLMSVKIVTGTGDESVFLYKYSVYSTLMAMAAMVIAFVTGTYVVLTTSLWLAILTAVIGLSFIILFYLIPIYMMTRLAKVK